MFCTMLLYVMYDASLLQKVSISYRPKYMITNTIIAHIKKRRLTMRHETRSASFMYPCTLHTGADL